MRGREGFSLLEVLIVIVILAFSIGAASVVIREQSLGNLSSDAAIVASRLEDAQAKALAGLAGTSWGIHFDNSATTPFYALFSGSSYTAASSTYFLSGVVKFTTPSAGSTTDVVFTKLTGMTATSTIIKLALKSDATKTATITVSSQGKIDISTSF